jgi:glyoxylase-like metal-dependent hydrolase (beta-lactamase superfamily II)
MKRLYYVFFMLFVASSALAQTADMQKRGLKESDFPKVHKIAENVYIYEMIRAPFRGEQFTTNNLVVVTNEGVLVADAQGSPADTTRLVEEIKKLTNQPIKYVVICSEHVDHTGGNAMFPAGVTFISQPLAKANFERQANAPNRAADAPKVMIPTDVVDGKKVMKLGNTEIQILNLGRAHVGSDLTVYLPKEKVLFLSETYFHNLFPAGANGYPSEWIAAIKKSQAMDVDTFVPGHGFIDPAPKLKADLVESRKALETVVAEAKRLHKPGATPEQIAEAVKMANFGPYATWGAFAAQGQPTFARAWAELDAPLK